MSPSSKNENEQDFDSEAPDTRITAGVGDIDPYSLEDSDGNSSSAEDSDLADENDEFAYLAEEGDEDIDSEALAEKEHYLEDVAEDGDVDEEGLEGNVKELHFDEDQPEPYGYGDDPNGYEDDED
ncbi:hypothetical protein LMG33818_000217 [Halomonadaceae bacterium LMG 33818]|uniref:hypothetical protein n=1 Tax=Cernens ardua TaxID=3402176 RepID=UPI003EDC8DF6